MSKRRAKAGRGRNWRRTARPDVADGRLLSFTNWIRKHRQKVAIIVASAVSLLLGSLIWLLWSSTFPDRSDVEKTSMLMFGDVQTPNESVQLYWTTEPPDTDSPRVTTLATYLITDRADARPYLLLSGALSFSLDNCKTGFLDQTGLAASRSDVPASKSPASQSYYLSALATGGSEADAIATVTQILPAADYQPQMLSGKERKFEFTCEFRTEDLWRSVGPSRVFDLPVVMTYDSTYEKVAEGSKGLGGTHDNSEESLIIRSTATSFLTRSGAPATVDGELLKWTFKPFEVFSFALNSGPPAGGAIWSTKGFSFGSDAGDARLQLTLLALGAMMSLFFETLWVLTKGTLRMLSGSTNWTEEDEIL